MLTIRLGQRDDLSSDQLKELLSGSIDVIRRRLFQVVKPERQAAIKQAMTAITGPSEREERRDFLPAQRTVLKLHREGMLGEGALLRDADLLEQLGADFPAAADGLVPFADDVGHGRVEVRDFIEPADAGVKNKMRSRRMIPGRGPRRSLR